MVPVTKKKISKMAIGKMLGNKRSEILELARNHGAREIRVFGSVARGEADDRSDVDFLVSMEPGRSLFDMGGLLVDLENLLGRPVDVVTEKGLRDRIRERILREAVPL
jgi:predicted nucleotidyltransferase